VQSCFIQLYHLQLKQHQTWQVWPDNIGLQKFLHGGSGVAVLDQTIASLMSDIRRRVNEVKKSINTAHTSLKDSLQDLRSALLSYNESTVITDTFVRYTNCMTFRFAVCVVHYDKFRVSLLPQMFKLL